jgi:hypothetical protein
MVIRDTDETPSLLRLGGSMPLLPWQAAAIVLGLALLSSSVFASEYCTNEQFARDRKLIEDAMRTGALSRGPKGMRDSILVEEVMWFGMNYPQQIAFMQSFECAMGGVGGKRLLYMDVRSLGNGRVLATWFQGVLEPAAPPD